MTPPNLIRERAFQSFYETNFRLLEKIYIQFNLQNISLKEWILFAYSQTSTNGLRMYID